MYRNNFDDVSWSNDSGVKLHVTPVSSQGNCCLLHTGGTPQCLLDQMNTRRASHTLNLQVCMCIRHLALTNVYMYFIMYMYMYMYMQTEM